MGSSQREIEGQGCEDDSFNGLCVVPSRRHDKITLSASCPGVSGVVFEFPNLALIDGATFLRWVVLCPSCNELGLFLMECA